MYLQYLEELRMQLSQTDQHRQEGRKENEREKQVELL